MTLQLRLGFWPVKSGQCSNVLPIVSVVGPNYQFQLLPTLNSMFLEILMRAPPPLGAGQRVHDLEVVDRPALVAGATSRAQAVNFMT